MEVNLAKSQTTAPAWFYGLAVLVTQMDGGAVSTLLSAVTKEYQLTSTSASWMAGLYTLLLVIATPVVANAADLYGQRKVFLAELALWFAGALVTYMGPTYLVVLLGRALQAIGDCGIIVMSVDAMMTLARQNHQGRKVSLMGIMSGLAALLAPIVAGMTLGISDNWHNFYGIMCPLILLLFLIGWKVLPTATGSSTKQADRAGAVVFSAGLACWMLALTFAQQIQQLGVMVVILALVGLAFFVAFPSLESRLSDDYQPFLPINLFKQRAYRDTVILGVIGGMFFAVFIYIPTYAETTFNLSAQSAGMMLTSPGLGSIIGSFVGGVLVDRFGNRQALVLSSALMLIATVTIAVTITSSTAFLVASFIMGIGMGAFMSAPLQVVAGRLAGREARAEAIGGISAGKKVGLTIAPLLMATSMDALANSTGLTLNSFRSIFIIAAVLALICLIISATMPLSDAN